MLKGTQDVRFSSVALGKSDSVGKKIFCRLRRMKNTDLLDIINSARDVGQVIKRPKMLFLACYFPPVHGSACVRTWNMAKYLARLGWDVTVVTPDPSLWRNVEQPERYRRN